MPRITALYENECIISFGDSGELFFINSPDGRAKLQTFCENNKCPALYNNVKKIWGDAPTVQDEREPTFNELKAEKKAEIASARYEREIAGVEVNGITIDTGRDSQALITGAALAAMLDEGYSLNWKTANGFIHLTAPEIITVAQAVRAHVQACFDREGELVALVNAAETKEDLDEIIISWPV